MRLNDMSDGTSVGTASIDHNSHRTRARGRPARCNKHSRAAAHQSSKGGSVQGQHTARGVPSSLRVSCRATLPRTREAED